MQKDKFELFLEQSKFTSDILNKAALKNLLIDLKQKKWIFEIELSEVVEPEVLLPFIEQIKTYFLVPKVVSAIDINFSYKDLSLVNKHALAYYDYAIFKLTRKKASFTIFKNFKSKLDDHIVKILIDEDSQHLSQYISDIEKTISKFGLHIKVELEINSKLIPTSKLIESSIV
ncbi:MAG: hypothetical protein RBT45_08265, partial [Acholeplasmataceae bacterium]|nr:hypothetical protein [Acholeplasmataceae bacterium]